MTSLDRLRALVLKHADGQVRRTIIEHVRIGSASAPTEARAGVSEPSVAIVAQGVKRTILNGRTFEYGAGEYLVVSVDLPVTGFVAAASEASPFAVVSLALKPATIASLLLETPARLRAAVPAFTGLAVSAVTPDLLDPVVRLVGLLDRPDDIPVLAAAYEREVVWRLLTGAQGATVREIGLADSSLTQIARSIRHLREHFAETLRVDDLAGLAGMSASSFHRHFRAATSMSPLQFQKLIRLQEAQALMMTRPPDIAQIGYLVGYDSPSQFSREYRRAFGASPSHDVGRLKAGAVLLE